MGPARLHRGPVADRPAVVFGGNHEAGVARLAPAGELAAGLDRAGVVVPHAQGSGPERDRVRRRVHPALVAGVGIGRPLAPLPVVALEVRAALRHRMAPAQHAAAGEDAAGGEGAGGDGGEALRPVAPPAPVADLARGVVAPADDAAVRLEDAGVGLADLDLPLRRRGGRGLAVDARRGGGHHHGEQQAGQRQGAHPMSAPTRRAPQQGGRRPLQSLLDSSLRRGKGERANGPSSGHRVVCRLDPRRSRPGS